ncbi:hypothetical protein ABE021_05710, partial [Sporosarcina gallistercoris]|uniref:hypothetical protein n=1 Tax=Sporosarcina gallistercoris TaxID=2762245 RepID=UPI003D2AF34B
RIKLSIKPAVDLQHITSSASLAQSVTYQSTLPPSLDRFLVLHYISSASMRIDCSIRTGIISDVYQID